MKAAPGMWGNPVDHPGGEGKGRDEKLPRFFLGGIEINQYLWIPIKQPTKHGNGKSTIGRCISY